MLRKVWCAMAVTIALVVPALVQAQEQYLDVTIIHVKPEKNTEFQILAKKVAEANRKNNGDRWLAEEMVYGEGYTYAFVSVRPDYASIDKGNDAFMAALNKAQGKDGAEKTLHDLDNCAVWLHTELRRRRLDLSRKVPTDAASYAKLIGTSRVLRATMVTVRPGHIAEFEGLLKDLKDAGESNPNTQPVLVSQVVEGGNGTVFYIAALRPSLGGFDKNPSMKEILGEDGYKKYLQSASEAVENVESMVMRFSPEMSYPPDQIAAASPDYWQPKPAVAAAKPKAKEQPSAETKPSQ